MKKELIIHNNQTIYEYTIQNDHLKATFMNVGAIMMSLVDIKTGVNIIVGHNDIETYLRNNPGYMNSVVGRSSGRIQDSVITLDGTSYELTKNFLKKHQLHGGFNGFSKKYFEANVYDDTIIFTAQSKHLEDGFPGDVTLTVTYRLIDNEIHILYDAISNHKTILNFTHHAYFNLNGHLSSGILGHSLYLNANYYLELDKEMIPIKKASVTNTPFDFTTEKQIGKDIKNNHEQLSIGSGFDHPFIINKDKQINHVATLKADQSPLQLDIYSDQEAVILYTGNFLGEYVTLNGTVKGFKHAALCLETQGIPNAASFDEYSERNIYDTGERYNQHTIWKISH